MCFESIPFFDFPYDVQIEIISHLDLKDVHEFGSTCLRAQDITSDKVFWKKFLWNYIKGVKYDPDKMYEDSIPKNAKVIIHDEAILDLQKLCNLLEIQPTENTYCIDHSRLMSILDRKLRTPSSKSWSNFMIMLTSLFRGHAPRVTSDPFVFGKGAPSILLFGPPETELSKRLIFSLLALKGSAFKPIGLVKGRPGGIGGGVTVMLKDTVMNFIPIRRARRGKLIHGEGANSVFHPNVVSAAKEVNGLIYYFDPRCRCKSNAPPPKRHPPKKKSPHKAIVPTPTIEHDLTSDMHELKAMLRSFEFDDDFTPPPILILMVCKDPSYTDEQYSSDSSSSEAEALAENRPRHEPHLLVPYLSPYRSPWMIRTVYMPSLRGLTEGFNWILKR